jgi:hypothetical protein
MMMEGFGSHNVIGSDNKGQYTMWNELILFFSMGGEDFAAPALHVGHPIPHLYVLFLEVSSVG